jgi:nucleoside recognition membrane protein YjiH
MAPSEPDRQPDPERAQRTRVRLLWSCAVLTVFVGVFELSDLLGRHDVRTWAVVVLGLCLLALLILYAACALGRTSLQHRVGPLDLFQLVTLLLVIAFVAGVLAPTRSTTNLTLLLPWGLTYWLHNLNQPTR